MENKNKEKNNFDYFFNRLYFVMTTFSTAGFGDIYPASLRLKAVTVIQFMFIIYYLI